MTQILKDRKSYIQRSDFEEDRFGRFLDEIVSDSGKTFNENEIQTLKNKIIEEVKSKKEVYADSLFDLVIREANDMISDKSPHYTYLSASAMRRSLYKKASKERGFDYKKGYGDFYSLVYSLTEKGIYSDEIVKSYSKEEIVAAGKLIDRSKDRLFSYAGLFLTDKNYLAKGYEEETLELPQERFMVASLYLLKDEPYHKRFGYVEKAYWALSNHKFGLATPTLMNAGKPSGSLSSCHIQTFDDSMVSIADGWKDMSLFSKNGSGLGLYLGLLRSEGSWIGGYKNRASGVIPLIKVYNAIAEYVDQQGKRKAGIAAYLPDFHLDLMDFLDLRLKTGSQERRAHSVFTGVCLHDEFMRRLNKRENWTLFDPYELQQKMGISLSFLYDKKKLNEGEEPNPTDHAFTYYYRLAEQRPDLIMKKTVRTADIYKKIYESQKTSGVPYIYYSDTVARFNPNSHAGTILCSNLCSEIAQNNLPDEFILKYLEDDGEVHEVKKGEGLVTCNLSSLCVHNIDFDDPNELQEVADIQFRLLDNVISLNRTPVEQATHTNHLYRAVGAGSLGWATKMADMGVMWDSDEAEKVVDSLYEKIAFANIQSSHKLAVEKGTYPLFEGSEWNTGEYFLKRGYVAQDNNCNIVPVQGKEHWFDLYQDVTTKGVRNSYMMAIAPTRSNAVIMNGSECLDAPYEVIFKEEKAGMSVTMVPTNYRLETMYYYKSAFEMDEMWSLKIISAAQKHVDQGISHNLHIHKDIKASELLRLHNAAWEMDIKTLYYTYPDTGEKARNEGCLMCEG